MRRVIITLTTLLAILAGARLQAQEIVPGPGRLELSIIPAGGVFFTENTDAREPGFGNYDLGAAVAVNFNRYIGVEGEVSGGIGVTQSLTFAGVTADQRTPHLVNYSGNLVVSAANRSSIVPYVTGGVGGLSVFEQANLGVSGTTTFLTGNVGAGVKWVGGRWGLRGDYRFIAVGSNDNAPDFFGRDTRYGHRVYGAVLLNLIR